MRNHNRMLAHQDDEGGHFARPWVWVMVDAFFLITAFFVCTFRVKTNEAVLPQKLNNEGPTVNDIRPLIADRVIRVHVTREGNVPAYHYHSVRGSLADLSASLVGAKETAGSVQVRVSYDSGVPFGDVMAVMNASTRAGIKNVGLAPLRFGS